MIEISRERERERDIKRERESLEQVSAFPVQTTHMHQPNNTHTYLHTPAAPAFSSTHNALSALATTSKGTPAAPEALRPGTRELKGGPAVRKYRCVCQHIYLIVYKHEFLVHVCVYVCMFVSVGDQEVLQV